MIEAGLDAYVLMGLEPELDCADGARARNALNAAKFVVSMSTFRSAAMSEYADVILPIAAFDETTFSRSADTTSIGITFLHVDEI